MVSARARAPPTANTVRTITTVTSGGVARESVGAVREKGAVLERYAVDGEAIISTTACHREAE